MPDLRISLATGSAQEKHDQEPTKQARDKASHDCQPEDVGTWYPHMEGGEQRPQQYAPQQLLPPREVRAVPPLDTNKYGK